MIRREAQPSSLEAYAPRGLLAGRRGQQAPSVASCETGGAVLLADLCGFTGLTAERAQHGRSGAEEVTSLLDRTIGPLVDRISECGGDVVAFAGDSVLAIWEDGDPDAPETTRRAARCALAGMQAHEALRCADPYLPLRIGVSAGRLRRLELGGVGGRWVHVAVGEAIESVLRVDGRRILGRVTLAPEAWSRLSGVALGEPRDEDFCLTGIGGPPEPDGEARPRDPPSPPPRLLAGFVPETVVQRLGAGAPQFVAEFRNVTVAFLAFDPTLAGDLDRVQEVVANAQSCADHFDGILHQLVQDDKGLTLVGVFGVPPRSHDDDPARAVEYANDLVDRLGELGVRARAAVSTGSTFCGDYGGVTRRHYGIVGESMNRAAALLASAEAGGVLCDRDTERRARRRRQFVALPERSLKGYAGTVRPYLIGANWNPAPQGSAAIVGRVALRGALGRHLERVRDGHDLPPMVLLEGDAGIGKTTVLSDLCRRGREAGMRVVWSQGESIRGRSSYAAIRPLVTSLGAEGADPPGAPGLLSAVLPERYAVDENVEGLTPQSRLEQLISLLRAWLEATARERPILWVVEDGHWVDSASQSVIRSLAGTIERFGVVVGRRPLTGNEALHGRDCETIRLEPLDRSETGELLASRLGVPELPEALLDVVHRRAAGNPLFSEDLTGDLLERGLVEVKDGRCRLLALPRDIEHVAAPPSLEGLITHRIDRLGPHDQLTLKAASVLGQSFDVGLLERVRGGDARALDAEVGSLASAGFLERVEGDDDVTFRHPLYQEITYGLLATPQRRLLHRRAAAALEEASEHARGRGLARLAIHWEQAGDAARALPLLTEAGDAALRSYANEEAIDLYERSLAARRAMGVEQAVDLEVARVERNIGAAHASLTRHAEARRHYQRAIGASGYAVASGRWSTGREFGRHLLHRLRRALSGRGAAALSGERRARALAVMTTMGGLAPVELWLGHQADYAHLALRISNIGDQLEPSSLSAGGATGLGYLLGLTPLRRFGEADLRRGLAAALRTRDAELRVMCGVLLGMFLTASGRPREAVDTLRPASAAGSQLEGGPWRHRSRFMLAEALLHAGEFEEAAARFDEAAELARHGEPEIVGFAHALGALGRFQAGRDREALTLLLGSEGVETTRRNEARLPLFASLGVLTEVCAATGLEPERGAAAAREAESLSGDWSDTASYFAGFFGYAGALEWWLGALESGDSGADPRVARMLRRFGRFTQRYPGARPRLDLFQARRAAAASRRRRARRLLRTALARAERYGQERDAAEARLRLVALASGVMPSAVEIRAHRAAGAGGAAPAPAEGGRA